MCLRVLFRGFWAANSEQRRITTVSDALKRLNGAKSMLEQRIDLLERHQKDHERELVELRIRCPKVHSMPAALRRKLKTALRRRRMCQLSIDKFEHLCGMLEGQILSIQNNETIGLTMSAIKAGNRISAQQNKALEAFDVDRLIDDFLESDEVAKRIADTMASTATMEDTLSDEAALDELERLIEDEQIQRKFVNDETSDLLRALPGVETADPGTTRASHEESTLIIEAL